MLSISRILTRIFIFTSLLHITACSSVGYLLHTSGGHLQLMNQRQSIESVLADESTHVKQKSALTQVVSMREFASRELFLPDNNSYTSYVALNREYVTWAVFAAPAYSLEAKTWCFWIVGCVPYRGYFDYLKAEQFAIQLQQQGYDTYIASVPAYSTLGWFSDPVLSSMLNQGELAMAEYIFHELAHQQIYIQNDASFNEAFASAVGQLGVEKWLAQQNKAELLARYIKSSRAKLEIYQLVGDLRMHLDKIYRAKQDKSIKHTAKQDAFKQYKKVMIEYLKSNNQYSHYKQWLLEDINNAKLNAFSTYWDLVPKFLALYHRCGGDFKKFYQRVEDMQPLEKQQRIDALSSSQC